MTILDAVYRTGNVGPIDVAIGEREAWMIADAVTRLRPSQHQLVVGVIAECDVPAVADTDSVEDVVLGDAARS